MEPNHLYILLKNHNLLNDLEFVLNIKFEATYAVVVRGGHSPSYIGIRKKKRLASNVNLLSHHELEELIHKFPFFNN